MGTSGHPYELFRNGHLGIGTGLLAAPGCAWAARCVCGSSGVCFCSLSSTSLLPTALRANPFAFLASKRWRGSEPGGQRKDQPIQSEAYRYMRRRGVHPDFLQMSLLQILHSFPSPLRFPQFPSVPSVSSQVSEKYRRAYLQPPKPHGQYQEGTRTKRNTFPLSPLTFGGQICPRIPLIDISYKHQRLRAAIVINRLILEDKAELSDARMTPKA